MGRKFVPQSTITARMDRKDRRFQAAAPRRAGGGPAFLQSEILGYASVAVVPAGRPLTLADVSPTSPTGPAPGWRAVFHGLLSPATADALAVSVADAERIAAQLREDDRLDDAREGGEGGCSVNCGFCGRCS